MAISLEDLIFEFLMETYGVKMRKGITKFEYEHPRDVIRYGFLETLDDPPRATRLRKLALLHDVVEDGCDLETIVSRFRLDLKERHLLILLSRNKVDPDGPGYWPAIIESEDALIIKLADRLANLVDLLAWIGNEGGFSEESLELYEKYTKEYSEFLPLFTPDILELSEVEDHPFGYQISFLDSLMTGLNALHLIYTQHKPLFKKYSAEILKGFAEFLEITKYKWRFKKDLSDYFRVEHEG